MNVIAGVAITLGKALEPEFRAYGAQVLRNAKALARGLMDRGGKLVTGGTDNHMMVLDTVKSFGLDGRAAEETLDADLHHHQQADHPRRPQPAAPPERHPHRHPGGDDARHDRGRHGEARGLDRSTRSGSATTPAPSTRLRGEVEAFCGRFPVPGL